VRQKDRILRSEKIGNYKQRGMREARKAVEEQQRLLDASRSRDE